MMTARTSNYNPDFDPDGVTEEELEADDRLREIEEELRKP